MSKKMNVWSLSWPIYIEFFLRTCLGLINTYMLSYFSDDSVGAIGMSNRLVSMLIVLYNVVGFGTSILVSQYIGAGKKEEAKRISSVAFYLNLGFGLLVGLLFAFFAEHLLTLMRMPESLLSEGVTYLRIVGLFSFSQALMSTMSGSIKSHGYTKISMVIAVGMNVINMCGVYIALFSPFGLPYFGVTGVAISTAISQFIAAICMLMMVKVKLGFLPSLKDLKPLPKNIIKDLYRIGLPSAGEHFSYISSQIFVTAFIATLGKQAITTSVYVLNVTDFIRIFAYSIGVGTQILIGHQVGAGKYKEAYKTCFKSLRLGFMASVTLACTAVLFRHSIIDLFTNDPEIIALGGAVIITTLWIDSGRSFNSVIINSLKGAGDVKFPVVMGIISMWGISVTMAYFLGIHLGLGLVGIYIAYGCDEWFRGLSMLLRWRSKKWESKTFIVPA